MSLLDQYCYFQGQFSVLILLVLLAVDNPYLFILFYIWFQRNYPFSSFYISLVILIWSFLLGPPIFTEWMLEYLRAHNLVLFCFLSTVILWVSHLVSWLNTIYMLITPELPALSSFWNSHLCVHSPCIQLIFNRQVKSTCLELNFSYFSSTCSINNSLQVVKTF